MKLCGVVFYQSDSDLLYGLIMDVMYCKKVYNYDEV